jgi:hypothetical protein
MSHIHDARNQSLSSLVHNLRLDSGANSARELRSKGNDLYVKQGQAFFTSTTSRASHRANAIALVKSSLVNESHATPKDADKILANVFGHAPTQITGGDVKRLHDLGQVAADFIEEGMSPVDAFEAAQRGDSLHTSARTSLDEPVVRRDSTSSEGSDPSVQSNEEEEPLVGANQSGPQQTPSSHSLPPPPPRLDGAHLSDSQDELSPLSLPPPPPSPFLDDDVSGLDGGPPPPPPPPGLPGIGVGGPTYAESRRLKLEQEPPPITPLPMANENVTLTALKDPKSTIGASYLPGPAPETLNGTSLINTRLEDFSEADRNAVKIAKEVLIEVRGKLPRGAFNNFQALPGYVKQELRHPDTPNICASWWNAVLQGVSGKALETLKKENPHTPEFLLSTAALAWATEAVGGGVCANLATLTTATLTTKLPPGSQITQVNHGFDHEFVAIKTPGSDNWFVVDPWPNEPHVVTFTDCYFQPEDVASHFTIDVTKTAPKDKPFGIDMSTLNAKKSDIVETVQEELDEDPDTSGRLTRTPWKDPVPKNKGKNDGVDPTFGRMAHDWNHTYNVSVSKDEAERTKFLKERIFCLGQSRRLGCERDCDP